MKVLPLTCDLGVGSCNHTLFQAHIRSLVSGKCLLSLSADAADPWEGAKAKKAGNKKKKISKAERLRQLQEEEERRLKEEEEARLRREREEQERLEIQRIEKEKWRRLEEKDLQRRTEELEELSLLEECFPEAERLKREMRLLSRWKHYIQCDGSPDPSVSQELNTFISLWKEETNENFEQVIEKSKLVLSLIEKLKLILSETPLYELEEKSVKQYQGSILQLQELLQLKFNVATEILLRNASTLADLDSGNMERIIRGENITLYIWANLKKNPRYRTVRFSETKVGFEIPRILAASGIALRLLHTHYDHVTPLRPLPTPPAAGDGDQEPNAAPAAEPVREELKNVEESSSQEDQQEAKEPESESNLVNEEEIRVEEQGEPVPEVHVVSVKEEPEAPKREPKIELLSRKISAVQLMLIKNAPDKPELFEDKEVDLLQFTTLGGVYNLEILQLPPQCRPVKGWMIVELLKEGLQRFTYPPETEDDNETEVSFPPIEVTIEVHKNVVFFEDPEVARWDAEGKYWTTDGISNISYKRKERLVTFSLDTFGPVTLIQDTHINMPYQSWELRPLESNTVLLTVTTVFTEVQIKIKENLCMLASIKLKDRKHLSVLEGKWMTPIPFINALKEAGVNIFPSEYSHFYVVMNNKVPVVEMKAYRQIALLSPAFAFGWSRWNMLCNSTKVVFKVKEYLREAAAESPKWDLLLFSGERAQRLKVDEDSESFSEALKDNTEFHSTVFHMVKDFASKEAMEVVRDPPCLLVDAVCHMLFSTRVLSYS
ncbi:dynein intermediate chain CFAP94, axonemal isoform X2 [Ochotona curzoniae]|uniref:dynein intermediate chain CFAP94, axonemal isoform X2 n=1 Tax=Ochotona curzoniae TaxID=130825 RepID=UPI001B34DC9F|nr:dynein intermediate chain CFAP94, axonemal isoform X2 [Ochotona curzoniae]